MPVPKARSWDELNAMLLEECKKDEQRMIGDRALSVGAGMCQEREHLLPLVEEGFELASIHFPKVNGSGCVKVLTNFYSVPVPVGTEVQAKAYAAHVEIWHGRQVHGAARALFPAGSKRCSIWSTIWRC